MSISETIETKITMSVSVWYLIFHQEDSFHDPQTLVVLES